MIYQDTTQAHAEAVILGSGTNGLAIARSLGKKGVKVLAVTDRDYNLCRFSCYCRSVRFPSLKDGEDLFLRNLIEQLGDSNKKPVLFSESDLYVMFMSRHREQLQKYFRFLLPDHELLNNIVSKERSVTFMREKGLRAPATYFLSGNNLKEILGDIQYPCLMKPIDSFSTRLDRKTMIFSDRSSLEIFLRERTDLIDQVIIQRIIPGGDSNIYQATTYVAKDGSVAPIFTMRKIRQCPPDFGITSFGISEDVPYLREQVLKLLSSIRYRGFISMEFKMDPDTLEWFYIESNPRLPYYHSLMRDCGINYPYTYYQDMVNPGFKIFSLQRQKNGVKWIYFVNDLRSLRKKWPIRQMNIMHWLASVLKARSFAILDRKDLKPLLYSYFYLIKVLYQKVIKKI